jgi:hydrogenase expression/formation protein HypE
VLHLANEGKLVLFVASDAADAALAAIRQVPEAKDAVIVGRVLASGEYARFNLDASRPRPLAVMQTDIGGVRAVEPPSGELLPRIC